MLLNHIFEHGGHGSGVIFKGVPNNLSTMYFVKKNSTFLTNLQEKIQEAKVRHYLKCFIFLLAEYAKGAFMLTCVYNADGVGHCCCS